MPTLLLPCRPGSSGPLPAREAYMSDPAFRDWRRHAEDSGLAWYVVSTRHGLLSPDDTVPGPYDVRIGAALRDRDYQRRLAHQLAAAGLGAADVVVLDADWFQELVAKALGVQKAEVGLRTGVSPNFRARG